MKDSKSGPIFKGPADPFQARKTRVSGAIRPMSEAQPKTNTDAQSVPATNATKPPANAAAYTEEMIRVLDDVEHVRTRPGMYIGGYNPRGLHHLVYEIVDNSIDEALAGFCKSILVKI